MMPLKDWQRLGETGMSKSDYTVGKFKINGVWIYKLWKGDIVIGQFESFKEADQAAMGIFKKKIDEEREAA